MCAYPRAKPVIYALTGYKHLQQKMGKSSDRRKPSSFLFLSHFPFTEALEVTALRLRVFILVFQERDERNSANS